MEIQFKDFGVEGAVDWLSRSSSLQDSEFELEWVRSCTQDSRYYTWNEVKHCFTVPSSSGSPSHSISVESAYCTCKAYARALYPDKRCVHVRDVANHFELRKWLRSPMYLIIATKERILFRALSNARVRITQSWFDSAVTRFKGAEGWFYSNKRDGVRVLLRPDGTVLTRNGLRLVGVERALRRAQQQLPNFEVECELTTENERTTSAARVQREVMHSTNLVEYGKQFLLWAFDVYCDEGTFAQRTELARSEAARCGWKHAEQRALEELRDAAELRTVLRNVLEAQHEGLVLQRGSELYVRGKRSRSIYNFKLKAVQ